MRSRFTHEGQLDHHADNEHELFRRADEALERQRREAHGATTAEHTTVGSVAVPLVNGITAPSSKPSTQPAIAVPRMPHEEIAERFALKPTTPVTRSNGRRR